MIHDPDLDDFLNHFYENYMPSLLETLFQLSPDCLTIESIFF